MVTTPVREREREAEGCYITVCKLETEGDWDSTTCAYTAYIDI